MAKLYVIIERKRKLTLTKNQLENFMSIKVALQRILKEILQIEQKVSPYSRACRKKTNDAAISSVQIRKTNWTKAKQRQSSP